MAPAKRHFIIMDFDTAPLELHVNVCRANKSHSFMLSIIPNLQYSVPG